jgi:hypothetical protein
MEFKSRQLTFIKEIIIFLKLPQGQKKLKKNIFTVINGHSMFLVRDHMVVGFTTICAISCELEPHSWRSVLDTTLYDKVDPDHGSPIFFYFFF